MSEHSESVKAAEDYLRSVLPRASEDHRPLIKQHIERLSLAHDHMRELERLTKALPSSLGDLSDLPEELLNELNIVRSDELEDQIVTVINACGEVATIDDILIGLFRKFKVTQKRRFLQNKLYRMTKNGVIWSVPNKKGTYATSELKASELADEDDAVIDEILEDTFPTTKPSGPRQDFSLDMDDEIPF